MWVCLLSTNDRGGWIKVLFFFWEGRGSFRMEMKRNSLRRLIKRSLIWEVFYQSIYLWSYEKGHMSIFFLNGFEHYFGVL